MLNAKATQRSLKATQRSLIVSIFFLSLASCAIFEGRETTGEYADDAAITTKVKRAFVADPLVDAAQVHVETMQGTVQLSGFVDSPKTELRAVELARRVNGVVAVHDGIVVRSNVNKD